MTSFPLPLSQAMSYVVGSVLNVVSLPPSTFHDINPILVSDGNDDVFRASSAMATTAIEMSPPHTTMGTVVTVLILIVGPIVISSHLTCRPSFSTDADFLQGFKQRSDDGNSGTTRSSNYVHHLNGVRGRS